jgi:hypothetical protein
MIDGGWYISARVNPPFIGRFIPAARTAFKLFDGNVTFPSINAQPHIAPCHKVHEDEAQLCISWYGEAIDALPPKNLYGTPIIGKLYIIHNEPFILVTKPNPSRQFTMDARAGELYRVKEYRRYPGVE